MKENKTYMCDGINENCLGEIPYDDVIWFTSRVGLCPICYGRLTRPLVPFKVIEFCYNEMDGGDDEMAEFLIGLTK